MKKAAICKPRRGLRRNQNCQHLNLGLLPSRIVRKEISVVETTSPALFCYGNPSKLQIIASIYKEFLEINKIKTNELILKMFKEYGRHSQEKEIQMAHKPMKKFMITH